VSALFSQKPTPKSLKLRRTITMKKY